MKKKRIILSIISSIILIGFICNFSNIDRNIKKEKQIIKEMSESIEITNLNNQINLLNAEHIDYANYIQTCKTKIATALTNEGVETSSDSTLEAMSENISKILQARTKDATATANDILEGKTAWINGEKISGINKGYDIGYNDGFNKGKASIENFVITFPVDTAWVTSKSINISSYYENYSSISINNIIPYFQSYPSIRNENATNAFQVAYTFSYNSSNGIFTVNCNTQMRTYNTFSMKLYIID